MIKPEFFTDDHLCSIDIEASHLFSGLWCFSDDYGAIYYSERSIMGDIYCKRESVKWKKVQKWIQDLINIGCLIQCSYCGRDYLVVTNWDEHQTINKPSARTYLEKSITYKVRLLYEELTHSGGCSVVDQESFLTVYRTKENKKENKKEKENRNSDMPPSFADVDSYCKSRNNGIDAQRFIDHYTSNGWKVGKNPMVDWQAAVRTWEKNNNNPKKESTGDRFDRIFSENGNDNE